MVTRRTFCFNCCVIRNCAILEIKDSVFKSQLLAGFHWGAHWGNVCGSVGAWQFTVSHTGVVLCNQELRSADCVFCSPVPLHLEMALVRNLSRLGRSLSCKKDLQIKVDK